MKKVLNVLCNIPLYLGLGVLYTAVAIKFVANKLFDFSFYLHVKANTDIGQKIATLTEQAKQFAAALRAHNEAQNTEGNKLARIFKPQELPNGVFQIGKKPTSDN